MQEGQAEPQERARVVVTEADPRREDLYARQIAAGTSAAQARSYADRFVFPDPHLAVGEGAGAKLPKPGGRRKAAPPASAAQHLAAAGNATKPAGSLAPMPSQDQKQLPLWPDLERAIPNHLARSSLFAPISRGARKTHDRAEIASSIGTAEEAQKMQDVLSFFALA